MNFLPLGTVGEQQMTFLASDLKLTIWIELRWPCVKQERHCDFSLGLCPTTLENGAVRQYSSNFPKKICILDFRYNEIMYTIPSLDLEYSTVDLLYCISSPTLPLAVRTAASPHFALCPLCIVKILNTWNVWNFSLSQITVSLASSTALVLIWFFSTCSYDFYYTFKEENGNYHTNYSSHIYLEGQIRILDADLKPLPFI